MFVFEINSEAFHINDCRSVIYYLNDLPKPTKSLQKNYYLNLNSENENISIYRWNELLQKTSLFENED